MVLAKIVDAMDGGGDWLARITLCAYAKNPVQDDQWAFGIMGDGSQSKQVIVGAVVLESYYVVFDRQVVGVSCSIVPTALCSAVQCCAVLTRSMAWHGMAWHGMVQHD